MGGSAEDRNWFQSVIDLWTNTLATRGAYFAVGLLLLVVGSGMSIGMLWFADVVKSALGGNFSLIFTGCCVLAFIGAFLLLFSLFSTLFSLRNAHVENRLQVLAWSGWHEKNIVGGRANNIDLLTYEEGWETPPRLGVRRRELEDVSDIDSAITDQLFLKRYHRRNALVRLNDLRISEDNRSDVWDAYEPFIKDACHKECMSNNVNMILGLPLEVGFSEILVNTTAIIDLDLKNRLNESQIAPHNVSYHDFHLPDLLTKNPELQVGIWDWYIPALLHLLLIHKDGLAELRNASEAGEQGVKKAIEPLLDPEFSDRFILLPTVDSITRALESRKVGIVLGSGSSALPMRQNRRPVFNAIRAVVPKEGLLFWANCFTIMQHKDAGMVRGAPLFRHWISDSVQKQLSEKSSYRSCPVTRPALDILLREDQHPSAPIIRWLQGLHSAPNGTFDSNLKPRQLPKHWHEWLGHWEDVEERFTVAE